MGHDMALNAFMEKKAKMLVLCSDVSPRLVREFKKTAELHNINIPIYETELTIDEIHFFVGYKAGVFTIDDENFSKKTASLLTAND